MTIIHSAEVFIEKSVALLKASPRDTSVSITYTHSKGEQKRPLVRFKAYNSKTGVCLVLKTHKVKEVNRLLNALGPRGSIVTKRGKEGDKSVELDGAASVMANVETKQEVKEEEKKREKKQEKENVAEANEEAKETAGTGTGSSKKSKKKKKKGKKN